MFKGIVSEESFRYYVFYIFIFIPIIPINVFFQIKKEYRWNAFLYALIGIGTLFSKVPANYSGAVFIIFSFYIFNNKITNLILFVGVVISIFSKNIFFNIDINNTINQFMVFTFSFAIYYFLIHPKPPKILKDFDYELAEVIKYKLQGYATKEIGDRLSLSSSAINKKMERARNDYNCKNNYQLIGKLIKQGFISP